MMSKVESPQELLTSYLRRKKTKSHNYSMRALARDIGKSPSYLSQIFSGKRSLSLKMFQKLTEILEMDDMAKQRLNIALLLDSKKSSVTKDVLRSTHHLSSGQQEYSTYEESLYKDFEILHQWYSVRYP